MYTKEQEKALKFKFWGGLNEQLELEKGFHANKVNWMNFNTNIKPLYFRMEADEVGARLCIDLQFPDDGIRALYYEQFTEFETKLNQLFEGNTKWQTNFLHTNGKTISRISIELEEVSIRNEKDWPKMYAFLTTNFVKLEHFWAEFGEVFIQLK